MLRIGTRKSDLAQTQSRTLQAFLRGKGLNSELVTMDSEGDVNLADPLYAMQTTPGVFTKRLERALRQGEADLVVHSLKDLPTEPQEDLQVVALSERAASLDCLIYRESVDDTLPLKQGAVVGSSSLRREAQLLSLRADLKVEPIRGNVPSRVRQVQDGKVDAVVLAEAGLNRLKLDLGKLKRRSLADPPFVPAPGQGVLAIQSRSDLNAEVRAALQSFHSKTSELETGVERRILRELEGGCSLPLGVRCELVGETLKVRVFLGVNGDTHEWKGFHHYAWEGSDPGAAVTEAVREMRGYLDG